MQYCHSWLFKQKSDPKFPCEKWTPCALVLLCTVIVVHQQDPVLGIASVHCLENPTCMIYMKITPPPPHKTTTTLAAKNQIKNSNKNKKQLYYIHGAPNAKYSMYNISTSFFLFHSGTKWNPHKVHKNMTRIWEGCNRGGGILNSIFNETICRLIITINFVS